MKAHTFGRFLRGGLTTVVFLAGLLAIAAPVQAGTGSSQWCTDNAPSWWDVPIISSPVTLNLEIGWGGPSPFVGVCYSTTPAGYSGPQATGGAIRVQALNTGNPTSDFASFQCDPDNNQNGVGVSCSGNSNPTYTINQGGANGGQQITVSIPFSICVGQCVNEGLNTTGLIVGTISQPSAGGENAAFKLDSVCVIVDGVPLNSCGQSPLETTGITTTGTSPMNINSQGPCVLEQCLPLFGTSYVGTTGNQLATIWLLGNPIPVYGQHTCVYQASTGTPCPY